MQQYSDPWLLVLARSGDKAAFSQLMTRYQPMAIRIAIRLVGNQDSAYELVQEAMLQAYLSLEHLRDTLRFKNWFYGIVLNICRGFLRTRYRPDPEKHRGARYVKSCFDTPSSVALYPER